MYLISNKTNSDILNNLGNEFIRPLLSILQEAAATKQSIFTTSSFCNAPEKTQTAIRDSMPVVNDRLSLNDLCERIVQKSTGQTLSGILNLYDQQTKTITSGDYDIAKTNIPADVSRLFSKYLYDELFDYEPLWSALGYSRLTRQVFHKNFRADNNYPSCCPYCDLDTINGQGNCVVEHFLPRKYFPLLSLNSNNLFSTCNSCNLGAAGKGINVVTKVTTPYVDEIGELVEFEFDNVKKQVSISSAPLREDVKGFLDLLQLPTRYRDVNTWHQFRGRTEAFVAAVAGRGYSEDEMVEYARKFSKGAVLNYALLSWVRSNYN